MTFKNAVSSWPPEGQHCIFKKVLTNTSCWNLVSLFHFHPRNINARTQDSKLKRLHPVFPVSFRANVRAYKVFQRWLSRYSSLFTPSNHSCSERKPIIKSKKTWWSSCNYIFQNVRRFLGPRRADPTKASCSPILRTPLNSSSCAKRISTPQVRTRDAYLCRYGSSITGETPDPLRRALLYAGSDASEPFPGKLTINYMKTWGSRFALQTYPRLASS